MLVSVVSVHTELLTPAPCSAHVADVACSSSHRSRPEKAALLDAVSAAVACAVSELCTAKLDVALSPALAACC